ncbi:MAG: hypothetical protein QG602_3104, partial [Verrucomicrobiota bacterium]|nr:hypothetical protein [Verrucomicrobiota bacterium]
MKSILPLTLIASGLLLAGCGKKEAASAAATTPATAPSAAAPSPTPAAPAAPAALVVEITANDAMKFSVTRFEVNAGQQVKLTFRNIGTMPKAAMGHNLVILKKGSDIKAYADAAMMAPATEYVPAAKADQV